jgi:hypothetical protein
MNHVPQTRSRADFFSSLLDIFPSRSLPPLECGFGVNPSQAARSRAALKFETSGSVAASALDVIVACPH